MKILITANSAWNLYNFRLGLMRYLQEAGHQVIAVAAEDTYAIKIQKAGFVFFPLSLNYTSINIAQECQLILQLYHIYRSLSPTLILHYTIKPNLYGTLVAYRLGCPVINNISGLGTTFVEGGWLQRIMWQGYRLVFPLAAHNFFQNKEDERLVRKKVSSKRFKSSTIPGSGVDVRYFSPRESSKSANIFTFLMLGRLITDKGVREYAEAAEICKKKGFSVEFLLAGSYDSSHRRAIPKKELRHWKDTQCLSYLGERKNVRALLARADCVVLPSYREGLPRTLLEAAAMAKPLIATHVPGCRSIVRAGYNGLLCQVKSGTSLAQACQVMMEMSIVKRKNMGKNSREWVLKCFDQQLVFNAYVQKIHEITTT